MDRRGFLKRALTTGVAATVGMTDVMVDAGRDGPPKRKLGMTGERLSVIGMGGIVVMSTEQSRADRLVHDAIGRGVNYFDVAPTYGNAQERLGHALSGYRNKVFLACKTGERTRKGAAAALEDSLRILRTDHVDLYQLHGLVKMEDLDQSLAPEGAIHAFLEARKSGKIRFLGFSAHSVEVALAAMDRFSFDTVLFPVNFVLYHKANFGPQVVAKAREKRMGCLAIKSLARTPWAPGVKQNYPKCWYQPVSDPEEAALALRFTLSEAVTAALPPGDERLFALALDAATKYRPLTKQDREVLAQRAAAINPIF